MSTRRQDFVTFISPGTFFAETTKKPIERRDPAMAVAMSKTVLERYGAKPYGFVFSTCIISDPIDDGEGGKLAVAPKTVDKSGTYYLGGRLETLDEVEARNDPKESILRSNMSNGRKSIVCVNQNSYKNTSPFEEADVLVDENGVIIERGDDPKHVAYRAQVSERLRLARGF